MSGKLVLGPNFGQTFVTQGSLSAQQQAYYTGLGYTFAAYTTLAGDVVDGVEDVAGGNNVTVLFGPAPYNTEPACVLTVAPSVTPAVAINIEDGSGNITTLNGNGNIPLANTNNVSYVSGGKVIVPGALGDILTPTINTANVTIPNGTFTSGTGFTTPITLTNATGEKRVYMIAASATIEMTINSGVTADTILAASLTSTVPFIGTPGAMTSLALGAENQIKTAPIASNGDNHQFSATHFIALNSGQSTNLNIGLAWQYNVISGSTASTVGSISSARLEVISVPAE